MNNVKTLAISVAIGIVLSGIALFAIGQSFYSGRIDKLTDQIALLETGNRDLTEQNTSLRELNSTATVELGQLRKELRDQAEYHRSELGRIKGDLSSISGDLSKTGVGIQDVIDGIERIKDMVKNL
jgi:SMC interacting uncharacterized protein involved in chromosome segregation